MALNRFQKFLLRTFFDGAKKTAANRDFNNASNSNFEDLVKYDRDTLRARARWLAANNPIMSNIDETIINNVIGKGIELQTEEKTQKSFEKWCKECDLTGRLKFADMQKLILNTRFVDGEILIYKKPTKDGLRIQLIEADQIDTYSGDSGLDLDKNGKVIGYYIETDDGVRRIDAKYIINYYKAKRATQYRGVSEYAKAITDIKNFQGFTTANIQSLRARANIAYVVEGNSVDPAAFGAVTQNGEDIQEINNAFVFYLNQGETIRALDSTTTPINYAEFVEATVRMIATARNISYELAFRDFSRVNFSSARASIIQDNKRFDAEQNHLIDYVLNDIVETWYEIETLLGRANGQMPIYSWITPAREWVQPDKDLDVVLRKIENNLEAPSTAAKSIGKDYEEVLKQKKEDIDKAKSILGDDYFQQEQRSASDNQRSKREIETIARAVAEELLKKDGNEQ